MLLPEKTIKIVQFSDTHLFADNETMLLGVKSNQTFRHVINKFLQEDIHDTDFVFLTGDLTQDETEMSYLHLIDALRPLNIPIYWVPGNHDDINMMEKIFNHSTSLVRKRLLSTYCWDFIFLNTRLEGAIDGYLTNEELNDLKANIASIPKHKSIAIIMHHHPAKVDTPLVDQYLLRNAQDFWHIVSGTQTRLVICGHVHNDYRFIYNDVHIETTPATCLQWQKGTSEKKFTKQIGYKIYRFSANHFISQVKLW